MTLWNNGTILFTELIPKEALEELHEKTGISTASKAKSFDTMCFGVEKVQGKPAVSILNVEEECGDLLDTLNEIVDILKPYGTKPQINECVEYYGDRDGYVVFTGEHFEDMDCEEYGAYTVSEEQMIQALRDKGYTVAPPEAKEKRIVLFLHDGVIEGGFTTDPSVRVTISVYDRDLDDKDVENDFWDECNAKGMQQFAPDIYHPSAEES